MKDWRFTFAYSFSTKPEMVILDHKHLKLPKSGINYVNDGDSMKVQQYICPHVSSSGQ